MEKVSSIAKYLAALKKVVPVKLKSFRKSKREGGVCFKREI